MRRIAVFLFLWALLFQNVTETYAQSTLQERVAARRAARVAKLLAAVDARRQERLARLEDAHALAVDEASKIDSIDQRRQNVVDLTNQERVKVGLPPLKYNNLLELSAQRHAQDMSTRNYFSHETPEGLSSKDRIARVGYANFTIRSCRCRSYTIAYGENLGKGQNTAEKVVRDWMNSPEHKENILLSEYKEIGIGIFGDVWVQNFGGVHMTY